MYLLASALLVIRILTGSHSSLPSKCSEITPKAIHSVKGPATLKLEQAASPLTAFLIGPLTQFVVIPFMTDGWGAGTIGPWFGTGPDRGIALVFVIVGLLGLVATVLAMYSRFYRELSAAVSSGSEAPDGKAGYAEVTPR